jgi:hypothetical protein
MESNILTWCRLTTLAVFAAALGACANNSVIVTGTQRPPITPAEVKIYSKPPPQFEEIGILNASSNSMFTTGGQKTMDSVIQGLKVEAAKMGANGVILEGFSDQATGSVGVGGGSGSYSGNSASSVGAGGSLGIYTKTGHGRAIYVAPEYQSQ